MPAKKTSQKTGWTVASHHAEKAAYGNPQRDPCCRAEPVE